MFYSLVYNRFDGDLVKCLRFQDDQLCEMAADEIERLHKIIKMMIYAAEKWDTMHIDAEGKTHYSGIGKEISNELKAIAKKDNARFLDDA